MTRYVVQAKVCSTWRVLPWDGREHSPYALSSLFRERTDAEAALPRLTRAYVVAGCPVRVRKVRIEGL